MPDAPSALAAAVRSAVDPAGLTVEQISAQTRIRATIVRDLLDGRTDSSHGDVYARGHLKAIAQAAGADPSPLLRAYEEQTGASLQTPDLEHTVHLHGQTAGSLGLPLAEPPERRGPRWGVALVAAGAVLVGLVVAGSVLGPAEPAPAGAGAAAPAASPSASARPAAAPTLRPRAPRQAGTTLRVRVSGGSSWVQVARGTDTLFEGVLDAGAVKDFRDASATSSLSVRVGNAGAVSLTCAGRGASAGPVGQVRAFRCAPTGLSPLSGARALS